MEKIFRAFFMLLMLALMMFLLGSSRVEKRSSVPSDVELLAEKIGESLPQSDRREWREISRKNPLLLIQFSSY